MAFNYASAVKSTVTVGSGAQLLDAATANFYKAALDEAANMYADSPIEGLKYFKERNVDKNNYSSQDVLGMGLAQVNSDLADPPVDKQQVGFDQTISNYVIRLFAAIGREALDTDRFGVMGDQSRALMHSGYKTIERIAADAFNRGFGTASLSLLAEDGLGLFSAGRPQPRSGAGTWTNLDDGGSLTADSVASARINFNKYLDGNGDLDPQKLEKVIVAPDQVDTMKEISGSTLSVGTSLNTINKVEGTPYECWHWLASGTVIYCGDGDNGVEFHTRENPSVTAYNDGTNIDKFWTRMYMAIGTGAKRPGKFIGAQVS